MKAVALLATTLMICSGCCSAHFKSGSDAEVTKKHDELQVLLDEVKIFAEGLLKLQAELGMDASSASPKYPHDAKLRDLDEAIKILRQARSRLASQRKRIHTEFGVGYGPSERTKPD